jgi:hypothetical protein
MCAAENVISIINTDNLPQNGTTIKQYVLILILYGHPVIANLATTSCL